MKVVANPDLNLLYGHLLKFAQQCLARQGGFFPFGATIDQEGQIQYVAAQDDNAADPDKPNPNFLIELLIEVFRSEASKENIRACGLCIDVSVSESKGGPKRDSIQCGLEHLSGESLNVFIPYTRDDSGSHSYGDAYSTSRKPEIFTKSDAAFSPPELIH